MVIRRADGTTEAIDYRERAPLGATRDMYVDENGAVIAGASTTGHLASGVPGTIAGLALAQQRHGKLKWADVVEPALKLAADGFEIDYHLARSLGGKTNSERLSRYAESKRIFLRDGKPYQQWEKLVQPELAATLKRIRDKGPREFYEGETARLIVEEMKRGGGLITLRDLKEYDPTIRQPLRGTYRGHEIITMPPPSSGGAVLLEMLNILERYDLGSVGHNASAYVHVLTETMRRAFADRAKFMGDTDFVAGVPIAGLISKKYADEIAKSIDLTKATSSSTVAAGNPSAYESTETTHFSIVDAEGNVVSNTTTLNDSYGSAVTVRGAGFLLNDEMDDFTSKPGTPNLYGLIQGEANAIAPRKRPLSSMTPTIVLKGGKPYLVVGSPGGPTIINTVLQIVLNVIDHDMTIQGAVDAPRFHHQWLPDEINWEREGLNADTRAILEKIGHKFREKEGFTDSTTIGDAHAILIDPESGMKLGASDPRLGGAPAGY